MAEKKKLDLEVARQQRARQAAGELVTTDGTMNHHVTLIPLRRSTWAVEYKGECIVKASTMPEQDVAIALATRGFRGTLITRHQGAAFDASRFDICALAAATAARRAKKVPLSQRALQVSDPRVPMKRRPRSASRSVAL